MPNSGAAMQCSITNIMPDVCKRINAQPPVDGVLVTEITDIIEPDREYYTYYPMIVLSEVVVSANC
jgi:hypothetical protein